MKSREGGIVGYNVQVAVDAEHHLIVAHEVTNDGLDRHQLSSMAGKAKEAVSATELTVVADRGYFKSEEILECTRPDHSTGAQVDDLQQPRRRSVRKQDLFISPRMTSIAARRAARDQEVQDRRGRLNDR